MLEQAGHRHLRGVGRRGGPESIVPDELRQTEGGTLGVMRGKDTGRELAGDQRLGCCNRACGNAREDNSRAAETGGTKQRRMAHRHPLMIFDGVVRLLAAATIPVINSG
jgi:hypothetical protein